MPQPCSLTFDVEVCNELPLLLVGVALFHYGDGQYAACSRLNKPHCPDATIIFPSRVSLSPRATRTVSRSPRLITSVDPLPVCFCTPSLCSPPSTAHLREMPSVLNAPTNLSQQQTASTASSATLTGAWSTHDGFAQVENMDTSNQVRALALSMAQT